MMALSGVKTEVLAAVDDHTRKESAGRWHQLLLAAD